MEKTGSKQTSLFQGVSMLRAEEKKKQSSSGPAGNSAMADYLKRYSDAPSATDADGVKKKKKRKKVGTAGEAIKIIDEDVLGESSRRKIPSNFSDEEREDDDFRPVVANEAEAKLLLRQKEQAKQFYKPKEDGSGWVQSRDPQSEGQHQSEDASPPRRRARHDSPEPSPPRRARHDSPDTSPPRRRQPHKQDEDASPPRRARHDSPEAPLHRRRQQESEDASPPRRAPQRHDSPDASPPRRRARHDSPDASPPRRGAKQQQDASPPRRTQSQRHDSPDASPPRRRARHDSPDASPPRRGGASPPRRQRHDSPDASPPRRRASSPDRSGPPRKMADGTAAGLVDAATLKAETDRIKAEAASRRAAAEGRNQETVYRLHGQRVSKEEYEAAKTKEKQKDKKKFEEVHLEWKGGLKQRQQAEEIAARMAQEAAAPFSRYENDADRDAILRQRSRFGDPMAHLAGGGGSSYQEPADLTQKYDVEKLQSSGFIIPQGIPSHSWLKRGVAASANRYNIKPGRHWDGVDRSNGYEKKMFSHMATVRHRELEARQWAMGDM